MRRLVQNIALNRGYSVSGASSRDDVADLVTALRPVQPSRPLVRLGPAGDGGYLVPDTLDGIAACFSPGVNDIVDFELALADKGIPSYLADFSIDFPPKMHPLFDFEQLFVGAHDRPGQITLERWVDAKVGSQSGDLLLQMDIEGSEYAALLATPDALLARFRILAIEFHNLHKLFDPMCLMLYRSCFEKLLAHFNVVHLHPNNVMGSDQMGSLVIPRAMEFTFERREPGLMPEPVLVFPHPLDEPCRPEYPSFTLPACWWQRDN